MGEFQMLRVDVAAMPALYVWTFVLLAALFLIEAVKVAHHRERRHRVHGDWRGHSFGDVRLCTGGARRRHGAETRFKHH